MRVPLPRSVLSWRTSLALAGLLAVGCGGNPMSMPAPMTATIDIATPLFQLDPGQESFRCYYTSLPSVDQLAVVQLDSTLAPGSHHVILFSTADPVQPDGTLGPCKLEGGAAAATIPVPLYLAQDAQGQLKLPSGTAMPLKAHQPLVFQMHYLNATLQPIMAGVKLRLTYTTGKFTRAGPFASYNTKIAVPPHGTQTVSGHCPVPLGSQFFSMTTHSHKQTTEAVAARWSNNQVGAMLVDTKDWAHPTVTTWSAPYMVLADGEEIYYSCAYQNDSDNLITSGQSAANNEMCMAVGYYFPTLHSTICVDSQSFTF